MLSVPHNTASEKCVMSEKILSKASAEDLPSTIIKLPEKNEVHDAMLGSAS